MSYTIAYDTRIGGREINQDRVVWLATSDTLLMVVADGMGGHLQGEVAAQIAIDTVIGKFRDEAKPRLAAPAHFLAAALRQAHQTIVDYTRDSRILSRVAPRTTCVACVVQDGEATWAHAGDSRLYLVRDKTSGLARVVRTRDHSIVQRMVDEGELNDAEAIGHPLRNRLFSCLGGDEVPQIEVSRPVPLQDGDMIALCTDGVWAQLGETLVSEIGRAPLDRGVPHLLDSAQRNAGANADNLTLIAMHWRAPDPDQNTLNLTPETPPAPRVAAISDAEIEHAIAEIRRRIPHNPNGAPR